MGTIMLNVLIACIKDLRVLVVFPNMELSESTKIRFQNDLIFHFLLSSNTVLENEFERIDRALPELGLLENRGKWEDVLKEYGTMWKDAMKE